MELLAAFINGFISCMQFIFTGLRDLLRLNFSLNAIIVIIFFALVIIRAVSDEIEKKEKTKRIKILKEN